MAEVPSNKSLNCHQLSVITYKSDVWSLGCILYNLLYGKTPFAHIPNTWAKLQAITDPTHRIDFPESGAPASLAGALRQCLRRDPATRPTVAQLIAVPYYDRPADLGRLERTLATDWPLAWQAVKHLFPDKEAKSQELK